MGQGTGGSGVADAEKILKAGTDEMAMEVAEGVGVSLPEDEGVVVVEGVGVDDKVVVVEGVCVDDAVEVLIDDAVVIDDAVEAAERVSAAVAVSEATA